MITVIGLGIALENLTLGAVEALQSGKKVLLRTEVTPVAKWLKDRNIPFVSMDEVYERTEDYDEVNKVICARVIKAAKEEDVLYGVLGGGGLMDATVKEIVKVAKEQGIEVRFISGIGNYEIAAAAIGGLDQASVMAAIDLENTRVDVSRPLIVCELNDKVTASECKLQLLEQYPANWQIFMDGKWIALEDLDRLYHYDHLSYAVLPALPNEKAETLNAQQLMERISQVEEQDESDLWKRLLMDAGSLKEDAEESLSTLLLDIFRLCRGYTDRSEFTLYDLFTDAAEKMKEHEETGADNTVTAQMERLSKDCSALLRADRVQALAKDVGFDWDDPKDALQKVREEADEVGEVLHDRDKLPGELGDLLFAAVNVCRMTGISPENALKLTTDKFMRRFSYIEKTAAETGRELTSMTLPEMDALWNEAKKKE